MKINNYRRNDDSDILMSISGLLRIDITRSDLSYLKSDIIPIHFDSADMAKKYRSI